MEEEEICQRNFTPEHWDLLLHAMDRGVGKTLAAAQKIFKARNPTWQDVVIGMSRNGIDRTFQLTLYVTHDKDCHWQSESPGFRSLTMLDIMMWMLNEEIHFKSQLPDSLSVLQSKLEYMVLS